MNWEHYFLFFPQQLLLDKLEKDKYDEDDYEEGDDRERYPE